MDNFNSRNNSYLSNAPIISTPGTDRNAILNNQLKRSEIETLRLQNEELHKQNALLQTLADNAVKSADEATKSAKHSKTCSIISLVIAGLMFLATVAEIFITLLK